MKNITQILFILMIISGPAWPQSSIAYRYSNTDLFKEESVVFTENYHPPIKLPANAILFTPTINEIIQAEHLLINRYNIDIKSLGFKEEKNVKKKYYKYKRQYIGFIDSNGNKKIIMKLLNFKCRKKPDKNFPNWDSEYLIGFGKYYEKNTRRYVINLNSGLISLDTVD